MADVAVNTLPTEASPVSADTVLTVKNADDELVRVSFDDIKNLIAPVTVLSPAGATHTLSPCPVTYAFGEKAELTVTVTATSQYHFSFSCPAATPTVLTITGATGTSGDTLEAGKRYEVDVWAGIALIKNIEVTAI